MPTMYQASAPIFIRNLKAAAAILAKAKAHCEARKIDEQAFLQARLYPDMFALPRQIQIASDAAKACMARLAGVDVPSWPDTESSFDELIARLNKTIAFVEGFTADQVDGTEDKTVTIMRRGEPVQVQGLPYLLEQTYPNFYFHLTIAYGLLRQGGVEIGKFDFLGLA